MGNCMPDGRFGPVMGLDVSFSCLGGTVFFSFEAIAGVYMLMTGRVRLELFRY